MKKPNNFWTKERCQEEAMQYNSRKEFQIGNSSAYNKARKNEWLNEICSHMLVTKQPKGYWTKERCQEEALKYSNNKEFRMKGNKTAYKIIYANVWYDELCFHMKNVRKPHNYWTEERCQVEALKYEYRKDFKFGSRRAYTKSLKNNWLDNICSHMKSCGNLMKRCIYVYEFDDNYAYIGLTFNIKKRESKHLIGGAVYNHIKKTKSNYKLIQLTDYIDVNLARNKEEEYVNDYKNDDWNILNTRKTGGTGNFSKTWSKERCHEEALKFPTKMEFRITNVTAYSVAHKNKWIDEICSHMKPKHKPKGYWTKEKCLEESLKYGSRWEFHSKCSSAYNNSYQNGWLDEVCVHMVKNHSK